MTLNYHDTILRLLLLAVLSAFIFSSFVPQAHSNNASAEAEGLDPKIDQLYEHLAKTKAIGIFTKLAVKNNASRLSKSFAVFHQGERPPNLEELRERYNLMVQEMVILVQDKDPELAREINSTRLLLWTYMSDPEKHKFI